jgi:kynurenine formamidase
VLLDVAGLYGVDILPPSYGIGSEDLKKCLQHQKTELRPGDVVMVRTGRMRAWPIVAGYMNNTPGINRDGAEALAKAGAMVIGSDTFCLEQMPTADPENWQVDHTYLLAEAGVPIMEIVDLEGPPPRSCIIRIPAPASGSRRAGAPNAARGDADSR